MKVGTLVHWRGRRHGFVEPNSGSESAAFCHQDDLPDELKRIKNRDGIRVTYDVVASDERGPRAINVNRER
jgi:cold shock CspA family protein